MNIKPNKGVITILIISLLIVLVAAQVSAFGYFVTTENNTITKEQAGVFKVLIQNTEEEEDYFTLSTRDVNWRIDVDPISGIIPGGEEKEFTVRLIPKPLVEEGKTYFIPVKVKSEKTGFFFEEREKFAVYVITPDLQPGLYVPTVSTVVYTDKVTDPREKASVRIRLTNKNKRLLENLRVVINGEVFYEDYDLTLLPLEDKTQEILFEMDPNLVPGMKSLTAKVYFEEKLIAESSTEYEIKGYEDLKESTSKNSLLFRTVETYDIANYGNENAVAQKRFRMGFFKRIFTQFSPEVTKIKGSDGLTYYSIEKEISPKEALHIELVTNYRILVIIIILIIVAILGYFTLRSPLIVVKNAKPIGKSKEGINSLKVRVYLKNRSAKAINNLRIIDKVPRIAEFEKKARLGSMEPVNVSSNKSGTTARWELDALEPYEERIITYRINSKLKMVGGIKLPSVKARFDGAGGKERTNFSNTLNLSYKK